MTSTAAIKSQPRWSRASRVTSTSASAVNGGVSTRNDRNSLRGPNKVM